MSKKVCVSAALLMVSIFVFAQTQTAVNLSSTISGANSRGFYRYLPADYSSSSKNYPLILWVHGAGQVGQGNTADLPKVLEWGTPKIISQGGFPPSFTVGDSSFSFIVISPQFIAWPTGNNLGAMLNYISANYRVDPERVYIVGISAGGGAAWQYAGTSLGNSNRLAAMIPFCGAIGATQAEASRMAASNLPVWAFHNTNDGTVPVAHSRNWRNFINGYVPTPNPLAKLTEFPVVSNNAVIAHDSWSLATLPTYKPEGINIYEWLLQYKKRTPNGLPFARAGDDAAIVLPANLSLDGSTSTDADGNIISHGWRKISGPSSFTISNPNVSSTTVTNLVAGIYGFELTVTDNQNGVGKDTMFANVSPPTVEGSQRRVLIDAGPPAANGGVLTPSPALNGNFWNNVTDGRVGNRLSNAKTTGNSNTNIGLDVINRIDGTFNTSGNGMNNVSSLGAVGDYPASATNDYAFAHNSATNGRWRIKGLEADKAYSIKFWGSKSGETRDRDIEIKRSDETIWKSYTGASNTNFNNAAFFTVTGITEVDFDIRVKAPSIFGYINVIDISWNVAPTVVTNAAPTANAGTNISIRLPLDSTLLNGCASFDPENAPLQFMWNKLSGPASGYLNNDRVCNPVLRNLTAGNYSYELMVTDTGNLSRKDTVDITVNNLSLAWPVLPAPACPEPYRIVTLGSSTTAGSGASPLDSSWVNKFKRYAQQQNAAVVITNLGVGGYNTYHVNPTGYVPPTDRPSPDVTKNITAALALNPDAIIINLPSNDAASAFPIVETQNNFNRIIAAADAAGVPVWVTTSQPRNNLSAGQTNSLFQMRDWVNQHFGNKAIDFWTNIANADGTINANYNSGDGIHLNNQGHHIIFSRAVQERIWDSICARRSNVPNILPNAHAGADIYTTSTPVVLNGTGSTDPDGSISSFSWRIINTGTASLSNANTPQPVLNSAAPGVFNIELTVTDNRQGADKDTVSVFVSLPNVSPMANAGTDQLIQLPTDSARLNGTASSDPNGTITAYKWVQIAGTAATISNDGIASPWVRYLQSGSYSFELTVTDDSGAIDKDTVVILVNRPPVANAGNDAAINLPMNTVNVSGTLSTDSDGTINTFAWRKISGPAGGAIANVSAVQTNISFTNTGLYVFELLVTDNNGGIGRDSIQITVNPNPNQAPVANAGVDQQIQLPVNNVLLDGRNSTDPDGTINSYLWSFLSGPSGAILGNANRDTSRLSFVNAGAYVYRLTVTDNGGRTATDDVQITVVGIPVTGKSLRINLFDATVTFNNPAWNNWKPVSNVNSTNFKYEDGTQSTINANLNAHDRFSDNGAAYGTGAVGCPPQVLRYNSIHTITRTLTLRGLNPAKQYSFEFYGARAFTSNSRSIFRVGSIADTIHTDFNLNDVARLNNITPDNTGRIVFTLSFIGTYHYMAGFAITEPGDAIAGRSSGIVSESEAISPIISEAIQGDAIVYPNPFKNNISLNISAFPTGPYLVQFTDAAGKIVLQHQQNKQPGATVGNVQAGYLKTGVYYLQIISQTYKKTYKIIKL